MEPLQAFGSIVHLDSFNAALSSVVQGDGSAAAIRVASPAPQPSQHAQQRASFTQPEHAAALLGLALFGPRWTDVAGIVAGREVRAPERQWAPAPLRCIGQGVAASNCAASRCNAMARACCLG